MAVVPRIIRALWLPLMRLALAIHFRRVDVLHRERFPRHGPALLVANHPACWADALVLEAVLGRPLHFLAEADQFRPWPRRWLVRLFGTVPVFHRGSVADFRARNREEFAHCESLLARGEAVAIFPEGVSVADREPLPLRRGAAKLALSYASRGSAAPALALVPVGLYYADRTAFRSDLVVRVGRPVAHEAPRGRAGGPEGDEAAGALTALLAQSLRDLVLSSDAGPRWGGPRTRRPSRSARLGWRALLALAAIPALAGAAIHAIPALLIAASTRSFAPDPSRVAFARMASGFLVLLFWYALLAAVLGIALGPAAALGGLAASALLGALALACASWLGAFRP